MGTWENNQNALREYANTLRDGIPSNYKNISNVALGSMINAAWAKQAQEEAERKRLLEVQKQKDLDAAEERKLKLKKMQYELDDIENARNSRNLLNTLAPYKPSYGFDSDTGENITTGSTPLDPIVQATANAAGLNLLGLNGLQDTKSQIANKALEDSVKALSLYSSDPQKYKELSEKQSKMDNDEEKGRMTEDVLSGVLPPYEFSYQMRNKPTDVYKKEKDNERMMQGYLIGLQKAQEKNQNNLDVANIKGSNSLNSEKEKTNRALELEALREALRKGQIEAVFDTNGKINGYRINKNYKDPQSSLSKEEIKDYRTYQNYWWKEFTRLWNAQDSKGNLLYGDLPFEQVAELATKNIETVYKQFDKYKNKFRTIAIEEANNCKSLFEEDEEGKESFFDKLNEIYQDYSSSLENPKGIQKILYSESGLK